uniref:Uncharacterized protein n=1 Tax=Arundo donax TaxID=35708 RepID=A0A0A9F0R3_ARUDO
MLPFLSHYTIHKQGIGNLHSNLLPTYC